MSQNMLNDALEVFSDNSELESVLLRNLKQSFEFFLSQYSLNIGYVYNQTSCEMLCFKQNRLIRLKNYSSFFRRTKQDGNCSEEKLFFLFLRKIFGNILNHNIV